ncbi:hypothetical protein [Actinokineospora bangkokensis]|uniref:Uncharacterized protein n=1 Tax=Actinokineospora bangkokensis TaxID=1193682 RepID=A0A1Q9LBZ3_9PSEU|nr:hypothetical protein [Actinokineospora bangkokensis]OLR89548.1 hypothetical protein BJP25_05585 [Actinokineospora bangkokensis]
MPRNRFTRDIRKRELAQLGKQEQELLVIGKRLRLQPDGPAELAEVSEHKRRRQLRIGTKQKFKKPHPAAVPAAS